MNSNIYYQTRFNTLRIAALAGVMLIGLPFAVAQEEEEEEVFELSPFEVSTDEDVGYWATNTLSGTRMNTENRFVGAAITEVTQLLMEDLAIDNFEDIVELVPNSAKEESGGLSADPTGNESIFGVRYRVRGFLLTGYSRDFFKTRVTPDSFNTERMSFSRGPNSILFGVAEPGGVTNAVSARAKFRDENRVGVRFDTWDSARYHATFNREVIDDVLAVRVAAVYDDHRNHRNPWKNKSERQYATLTFKPFKNTTIRGSYEQGDVLRYNVRSWAPSDGMSAWLSAGAQSLPEHMINPAARTSAADRLAYGVQEFRGNAPWVAYTTGNVDQPTVAQIRWELRPALNSVPGIALSGNSTISFQDNSIVPMTANVLGNGNKLVQDYSNNTVILEQKLADKLYLELAYNRQDTDNMPDFSTGARDAVYIDLLPTLRSVYRDHTAATIGEPFANPNYGKYFTFNDTPTTFDQIYDDETFRATLSYELDIESFWDSIFGKILGQHRMASMWENYEQSFINKNYSFRNSHRRPDRTSYFANSSIALVNYIDIENGNFDPANIASMYPRIWQENADEIPEVDSSGVSPVWLGNAGTNSITDTTSKMFAMQNYFWDRMVVTTFGWRNDSVDSWRVDRTIDPVTQLRNDIALVNPKDSDALSVEGDTITRGVVVTPLSWLGVFYNESNNFRPANADQVDIFGNPMGNESGEGKDYGLKLYLLDGKITGSLTFFETTFLNQSTRGPRVGPVGQFDTPRVQARQAIVEYYEDLGTPELSEKWQARGYFNNDTYYASQDFASEGFELSITMNPTRNWRIMFNFSKQENVSSNVAPEMRRWTEFIRGELTDPVLLDLETNMLSPDGVTYNTVRDTLDLSAQRAVEIASLEGFADQRQPEKSANLVASYTFTDGALKGLNVGGQFRWRDRAAIGYQLQPDGSGALDATKPYMNNTTEWFGMFISYRMKIFRDVNMRIQLNIDNLLDNEDQNPLLARDVNGERFENRWIIPEGRSFALSAVFDF